MSIVWPRMDDRTWFLLWIDAWDTHQQRDTSHPSVSVSVSHSFVDRMGERNGRRESSLSLSQPPSDPRRNERQCVRERERERRLVSICFDPTRGGRGRRWVLLDPSTTRPDAPPFRRCTLPSPSHSQGDRHRRASLERGCGRGGVIQGEVRRRHPKWFVTTNTSQFAFRHRFARHGNGKVRLMTRTKPHTRQTKERSTKDTPEKKKNGGHGETKRERKRENGRD